MIGSDEMPGVDWLLRHPRERRALQTVSEHGAYPLTAMSGICSPRDRSSSASHTPTLVRHREVGHDHVGSDRGAEIEGLTGRTGRGHERPGVLEDPLPQVSAVVVVLDDQFVIPARLCATSCRPTTQATRQIVLPSLPPLPRRHEHGFGHAIGPPAVVPSCETVLQPSRAVEVKVRTVGA